MKRKSKSSEDDEPSSVYLEHTDSHDFLEWHTEKSDKTVVSVYPTDWKFQFEDELPTSIDSEIFVPKNTSFRLLRGTSPITIQIKY